ncbi:tail fiber domain-containing protein, partial [Brucella abortus]
KTIPVIDAIGVTMKAVQDLSKQVKEIAGEIGLGPSKDKAPAKQARKPSRGMELGLGVAA